MMRDDGPCKVIITALIVEIMFPAFKFGITFSFVKGTAECLLIGQSNYS